MPRQRWSMALARILFKVPEKEKIGAPLLRISPRTKMRCRVLLPRSFVTNVLLLQQAQQRPRHLHIFKDMDSVKPIHKTTEKW